MISKQIGLAVIGAGAMGQNHIGLIQEEIGATSVAIADDLEDAKKFAEECKCSQTGY